MADTSARDREDGLVCSRSVVIRGQAEENAFPVRSVNLQTCINEMKERRSTLSPFVLPTPSIFGERRRRPDFYLLLLPKLEISVDLRLDRSH